MHHAIRDGGLLLRGRLHLHLFLERRLLFDLFDMVLWDNCALIERGADFKLGCLSEKRKISVRIKRDSQGVSGPLT